MKAARVKFIKMMYVAKIQSQTTDPYGNTDCRQALNFEELHFEVFRYALCPDFFVA